MTDERIMVLKLIEEGKISADEGLMLLEALGGDSKEKSYVKDEAYDYRESISRLTGEIKEAVLQSSQSAKEATREARLAAKEAAKEAKAKARSAAIEAKLHAKDAEREAKREAKERQRQIREEAEEAAEKIKSRILDTEWEDTLLNTLDGVGNLVTSVLSGVEKAIGFNFYDNTYSFEEVIEGNFSESEDNSGEFIHVQTANGRIEVYGWEEDKFRLVLTKKIKAGSEEEAQAKIDNRVTVSHSDAGLIVDAKSLKGINAGMSVELWLPRDKVFDFTFDTGNGRITMEDLNAEGIEARTSNGRIVLVGVTAKAAHLRSSNGSIRCDGGIPLLTAYTSNGSINLATSEEDVNAYELSTTNGAVRVMVDDCDDLAHDFDLSTSFGKIRVNLPEAVGGYQQNVKYRLLDTTENLTTYPKRLRLAAATSNGNITVSPNEV